ncbi:MAG: GNAT family N-acetyltransferase [Chitinophagales bacterium]
MDFTLHTARREEAAVVHGVITSEGWPIRLPSVEAIMAWDPEAYLIARNGAGEPVGVIFGLGPSYGRTGWLGHLVVKPECRGGGVGKALFGAALARLRKLGRNPVYLTATAMGAPIYAKFGFVEDGFWSRWQGIAAPERVAAEAKGGCAVREMTEADLARVAAFDAVRFGDDRSVQLRDLFRAYPGAGRVAERPGGELAGYLLRGTDGLGPFVADPEAAAPLFHSALALFAGGPVYFSFPDGNPRAAGLCRAAGLAPVDRKWLRMRLGDDPTPPDDATLFNASVAKG